MKIKSYEVFLSIAALTLIVLFYLLGIIVTNSRISPAGGRLLEMKLSDIYVNWSRQLVCL